MILPKELPPINESERLRAYEPKGDTEPVKILSKEEVAQLLDLFDQGIKNTANYTELFNFLVAVQERDSVFAAYGPLQRVAHTYKGILYGMNYLMFNGNSTISSEKHIRGYIENFFSKAKILMEEDFFTFPVEHIDVLVTVLTQESMAPNVHAERQTVV